MICKSLICFCSGTPGGRVDVVERMIGHIFVDMWAFLGGVRFPPLPSCFLLLLLLPCYHLALLRLLFFFLIGNLLDWERRQEEEEDQEEEGKHLNHFNEQERGNDSYTPQGILPQYGDPRGG